MGYIQPTYQSNSGIKQRQILARYWSKIFLGSILIAILALMVMLINVINDSYGYAAIEYEYDPSIYTPKPIEDLNKVELMKLLSENLSTYRWRTIQQDVSIDQLEVDEIRELVVEELLKPTVVASYSLIPSLFNRTEIHQEINFYHPEARIDFYSWLDFQFLIKSMSVVPENSGVRTAILGSLWIILVAGIFAIPVGIGAAIYLEEYAPSGKFKKIIQSNIDNLAGVPSIIYGILGLAIFVRVLKPLTSGTIFGLELSTGRTIISAGMTIGLLLLPVIIINTQEALRTVPMSLRQASYGVGATRWQTLWYHVLPAALPGILTGAILAISRGIGETSPLILVGASSFINKDPTNIFSNFTTLPLQIYYWTQRPQDQFRNTAAAAILVLLIMLLSLNAVAIILRNHYSRQSRP
ncbi:MAG: phosphate ABC transporter permease PstA [Anaerolineaceae bacterium]|nr:phosphate ABC transporter permease PstA [Anaerolineaceae bacterium]MBN2678458.1 phosphate ABC transporter permease PstA [Anaerolineaceae bacterium]